MHIRPSWLAVYQGKPVIVLGLQTSSTGQVTGQATGQVKDQATGQALQAAYNPQEG